MAATNKTTMTVRSTVTGAAIMMALAVAFTAILAWGIIGAPTGTTLAVVLACAAVALVADWVGAAGGR